MEATADTPGWIDLKRRTRLLTISLLLLVIAMVAVFLAVTTQVRALGALAVVAIGLGMPLYVWSWFRFSHFRCPRCRKKFFLTLLSVNPFARKCRHCGLQKGGVLS